jgi:ADP-ribose pyrophosphatase YjhB (NUDIX family)
MKPIDRFNIRVYGIWIDGDKQVLLSDELVGGRKITKFPGGGMKFGEGPAEAIRREWKEELGCEINIVQQLYFSDFFVPSFMDDGSQVISLYFQVQPTTPLQVPLATQPFDFKKEKDGAESFRKAPIDMLDSGFISLPIDKELIKQILSDTKDK